MFASHSVGVSVPLTVPQRLVLVALFGASLSPCAIATVHRLAGRSYMSDDITKIATAQLHARSLIQPIDRRRGGRALDLTGRYALTERGRAIASAL